MTYAAKKRRRIDWAHLAGVVILLMVFLAIVYLGYRIIRMERIPAALKSENSHAGAITEINDRYLIAAYYPEESNGELEKKLKEQLQKRIDAFKSETAEIEVADKNSRLVYFCDYQRYEDGDILSYLFLEKEGNNPLLLEEKDFFTAAYDKAKKEEATLDFLFLGDYRKQMAALLRREFKKSAYADQTDLEKFYLFTQAESSLYDFFVIRDQKLSFCFDSREILTEDKGIIMQDIPLAEMDFCLKEDLHTAETVAATADDAKRLRYVDALKPMVALTYDDGPYGPVTERLLDALKKVNGAATFFVVGSRVNWRANAGMIERAIAEGSEVGCHTYNHSNLTKLTTEEIQKEIKDTVEAIEAKVEGYHVLSVRPVGGAYDDHVKQSVNYVMYNWSVDSLDWKSRDRDAILEKVRASIEDGDIVLMHDLYESTAEASEVLIPELARTYQLVTVTELMEYKGVQVKAGDVVLSPMKKIR